MERLIPKPSSAAPRCKFRQIKAANEHEASLLSQIPGFYKEQRNLFSLPRLRLKYDVILLPQSWFGSSRNRFFIWAGPFFSWCLGLVSEKHRVIGQTFRVGVVNAEEPKCCVVLFEVVEKLGAKLCDYQLA